jgi:hypothetical protein
VAAAAPAAHSKPAASSQRREEGQRREDTAVAQYKRREEAAAGQDNEPPRRERVRKRRPAGLNIGPDAEHSDLYMAVAHELRQLEQLQQNLQQQHHRKRSRQHDGPATAEQPDGNAVAKRLRTALQGSAAAGRVSTDGHRQQQQLPDLKQERGAGSNGDADMSDAAAAGEASEQDAANAGLGPAGASASAAAAGERPNSGSFAATLEARVKQQLAQGRTPVPSPNGKASGPQHAAAAAAAAIAEQAEQHAVKVKAERELAALAAELGVLAASVSDGPVSSDSAGAVGSPKASSQQQQHGSSGSAGGTPPPPPLAAGTFAGAAGAGASGGGSSDEDAAAAVASPGSSPGSDGKPSTRRRCKGWVSYMHGCILADSFFCSCCRVAFTYVVEFLLLKLLIPPLERVNDQHASCLKS